MMMAEEGPSQESTKDNKTRTRMVNRSKLMDKRDKMASVLHLVGGKPENVEKIVDEIDEFMNTLNAELEDWKVSMEEFQDGTRIFARFQVLVKN